MILVDSCIYIEWMRAGENPVHRLQPHHASLVSCGVVHLEVLRGITTPRVKAYLTDFFNLLPQVSLSANLLEKATELAWTSDRKGVVLPVTDLLIAACALQVGATVVTRDRHFSRIPDLTVQAEL